MKIRVSDIFFKPYLFFYLKKYSSQLKNIKCLKNTPKTFLVISNTALGDAILSTPAIKSLKKSFPNSQIVALIYKSYIPLFDNFKYIDTIIPFYGKYKKFFQTIKEIKKYRPQMTLIFHGNGPQDIQIAIYSGCEYILKHPNNSPFKKYLSYDFEKKDKHIIEERVELVKKLGGKKIDLNLEIGALLDKKLLKKYKKYKNYIGFQVGASETYRMWPIENYISLAKELLKNGEKILITGVENESVYAEKIIASCDNKIKNMCGKTSIKELPYLIDNLKILVTSDTGTLHLAIALKTPTISLFSPSNPKYTGPYQDFNIHKIIKKPGEFVNNRPKKKRSSEAMKLIAVGDVFTEYKNIIK
ncbi:MAG: glycosyltransferase family 9 protein [Epsilonproteobacteria bacterium]|nr:glycosyltransferase family 9 protein [Campylobacterota bacterium]